MHILPNKPQNPSSMPNKQPSPLPHLPPKKAFIRAMRNRKNPVTRISKPAPSTRTCYNCTTTDTRQWLRGDQRWLCHRCGQYWRKNRRHRPSTFWYKPVLSRKKHTKITPSSFPSPPSPPSSASPATPSSPASPATPSPPASPATPSSPNSPAPPSSPASTE